MRILLRPRAPVLALLFLSPAIPELLTGSTPITTLVTNPPGFALSFGLDVGLYGTGALLIREFVAAYRKGWASTLLLGAAYGIGEEGFAVHTFFERSGPPVGVLGAYGHALGVNWLWALGLTAFHATYSIALPILLVGLWYPQARTARWLDRGLVALCAGVYLAVVALLAFTVGHGPTPFASSVFAGLAVALVVLAAVVPADLLSVRLGPTRIGTVGLVLAGGVGFAAWVVVIVVASASLVPATVAAAELVLANVGVLALVLRRVGTDDLRRSEFRFAVGMMGALFLWDIVIEASVPGILAVAVAFGYLLYRLRRRLVDRGRPTPAAA